jgi:hypothetical protein
MLLAMQLSVGIWNAYFISARKYGIRRHSPIETLQTHLRPLWTPQPPRLRFLHVTAEQTLFVLCFVALAALATLVTVGTTIRAARAARRAEPDHPAENDLADDPPGERRAGGDPAGDHLAGDDLAGVRPAGEAAAGNRPAGDDPAREDPADDYVAGDLPAEGDPAGDRFAGDRSAGERRADGDSGSGPVVAAVPRPHARPALIPAFDVTLLLVTLGAWLVPHVAGGSVSLYRSEAFVILGVPLLRRLPAWLLVLPLGAAGFVAWQLAPYYFNGTLT